MNKRTHYDTNCINFKISESRMCGGYELYAYKYTDDGQMIFAKPIVLDFEEVKPISEYMVRPLPSLVIDDRKALEHCASSENKLLSQKNDDKNAHIKNLDSIIEKLIASKRSLYEFLDKSVFKDVEGESNEKRKT